MFITIMVNKVNKVKKVLKEFANHKLKSHNKKVKSKKQALAIGYSEQRALARKQAGKLTALEKRVKFH